jgi:hypothetical protein
MVTTICNSASRNRHLVPEWMTEFVCLDFSLRNLEYISFLIQVLKIPKDKNDFNMKLKKRGQ